MAEGGDGNELIKQCTDGVRHMDGGKANSFFDIGHCLGLTQGVRQTLIIVDDDQPKIYKTCIPESITNGQGMRIVLKYLQDNPDKLHESEAILVYLAYRKAFPCK